MSRPSAPAVQHDGITLGAHLFSFAVVADTHVTEREGESSSPWPVNRLANARNRFVVRELNQLKVAFVLHLGDIVHPVPAQQSYAQAAAAFHALMADLTPPLHLTPGNHDVGDKPLAWMPAGTVTDEYVRLYERSFGSHFYSFDANGCHIVVINAQIINSGLRCEQEQADWLEADLRTHHGRRIFLCTHYPPYVSEPNEPSSYDNIDEPGRGWLLDLLQRHAVEAVFAGHVHNFWYDVQGPTEFYVLPSTAFVRQDYSEFYRIEPGPENGRNDVPKLGYLMVDVHEFGHVAHVMRTYGQALDVDTQANPPAGATRTRVTPVHTKTNPRAAVGIDLRHPWAERVDIAASGGVDEFERKKIRNDYPLLALWEMGIRKLRVPLQDLVDPYTCARMRSLHRKLGHRFTVYSFDVPRGIARDALIANGDIVAAWELILDWADAPDRIGAVIDIKTSASISVYWSKLRKHADVIADAGRYSHMIGHGFTLTEIDTVSEFLAASGTRAAADGFVVRVPYERAVWDDVHAARAMGEALGTRIALHVRLAGSTPGVAARGDLATANRVAEAVAAALAGPDIDIFLDTFNDVDRSFFAREGLVDRRYNPKLASHVIRHLTAVLAPLRELHVNYELPVRNARVLTLNDGHRAWLLVLPAHPFSLGGLTSDAWHLAASGNAEVIDLATGEIACTSWDASTGSIGIGQQPFVCNGPCLIGLPAAHMTATTEEMAV